MQIPDPTPELLAKLGRELGGCDFSDANQIEFLSSTVSCDVQAVPGNGKTTLLAAKLALLLEVKNAGCVCNFPHQRGARGNREIAICTSQCRCLP